MIETVGDTVRFDITFDEWSLYGETEVGAFDPDFHTISYKVTNSGGRTVESGVTERLGIGRYILEWTALSPPDTYIIEFVGDYNYLPHTKRVKVKTRF